jgi:hypothetical protein
MPKEPSPLYDHRARNATARQLNLSTNASGRSSYSYSSSQVPITPIAPKPPVEQDYAQDFNMDVDNSEHHAPDGILNTIDEDGPDEGLRTEVMPGVRVKIIPKPKAKRYANSVRVLCILIVTPTKTIMS